MVIRWKDFECDLQSSFPDGIATIIDTDYKLLNYNVDSNGIRVTIRDGGADYVFDGLDTVVGTVLCSNGLTYTAEVTDKSMGEDGTKAWFVVPHDVYNFLGPCIVSILIINGNVKTTVLSARMTIDRIVTLPVLAPTAVVPDITEIQSLIGTMVTARDNANTAAQTANTAAEAVGENFAETYVPNTAYGVGGYVIYEGVWYRCTTAVPATEDDFNPAHWDAVNVGEELLGIINNIPIATVAEIETYLGI